MKKSNIKVILIIVALIIVLVAIIGISKNLIKNKSLQIDENNTSEYDYDDASYDILTAINIELEGESINVDSKNVEVNKNVATIKAGGVYVLSGNLNGSINIQTEELVRIVLKNVAIESNDGPAIYVKSADKVIITLDENTTNTLKDCTTYTDSEASATIYSKDDLIFNGYGTLIVEGNYEDAIVSKDDLKIISGIYDIKAMNSGIKGKDSVTIKDGNVTVVAQNDCIKSTNSEDENKGYVKIKNGTLTLNAEHDAIQSENYVFIENGNINITTGGGSENSSKVGVETDMFIRGAFMKPDEQNFKSNENKEDTASYKGIKAQKSISILSGNITINSADDSIHSNGNVEISGAEITIESGDDGIHADDLIVINSGNINITKSYEGIEANNITINDGNIKVVSSDDGINISGGNDSSSMMGRPGQNNFSKASDNKLEINGGNIYVNSTGDGLDSNGSIYVNGGIIYVDGPTDGGNGALDYDVEFIMKGGEIIAAGSAQMAQAISNNSTVNCLNITLSATQKANSKVSITDSKNNEIISYTPSKQYQSIVIASSKLTKNETYNINIDGNKYTSVTISSVVTNIGNSQGMQQMQGPRR